MRSTMAGVEHGATFEQVDTIFAEYPGREYRHRVRPSATVPHKYDRTTRIPRMTSFSELQQRYVSATNRGLVAIYSKDLAINIGENYASGETFNSACYTSVTNGLDTFAQIYTNLLPALKAVMVDSDAGSQGVSLTIGYVNGYVKRGADRVELQHPFFLPQESSTRWVPDGYSFIGTNKEHDQGMMCSSLNVATVIYNSAIKAYTSLTEEHCAGFLIGGEGDFASIPRRLRRHVKELYSREKTKRKQS